MKKELAEKRRYIRLNTVFPIEFQFVDEKKEPSSYIFQGFTRNVGKGGICIEAKTEKGRNIFNLLPNKTKVKLIINIPSSAFATKSYATVRWSEKISEYMLDTHIFGVEYDEIESDNQKMIERYVLWLHRKPRILLAIFILSIIAAVVLTYLGIRPR